MAECDFMKSCAGIEAVRRMADLRRQRFLFHKSISILYACIGVRWASALFPNSGACILHSSSFTRHPSPVILTLHPSSFTLHPSFQQIPSNDEHQSREGGHPDILAHKEMDENQGKEGGEEDQGPDLGC